MKSRKYMKAKHKTYKQELSVFSKTTDRKKDKKNLKILCYTTIVLVTTGNGQYV